jgi:hypothetical protein
MADRFDFIEQMLQESEERQAQERVEMDRLRADTMLKAVAVLDGQMAEVNALCDKEMARIEDYRVAELSRLEKKRSWLTFNLDAYIRAKGEKTLRLPNGVVKLRKGRDRITVVAMDDFLKVAGKLGLLKTIPESYQPDNQKMLEYLKRTGAVPDGCEFIPAETKFSYSTTMEETNGANANKERQAEAGIAA